MARFSVKTSSGDAAIEAASNGPGIISETSSTGQDAAVSGIAAEPRGSGAGVIGQTRGTGAGVVGLGNASGLGGFFAAVDKGALVCETQSATQATAALYQKNPAGYAALHAEHLGNGLAAFFKGNVFVTGDVSFQGQDCAEEFAVDEAALSEPGTVMVVAEDGRLTACSEAYDRKVAGVVAGAGLFRPGIVMGRDGADIGPRSAIALAGRTYCKVDAAHGAIATGDLLTTSPTPGHAMRAGDPQRAFGAVIGKAMALHRDGTGLIPILVALQ